jgi:hypothetical protein
MKGRRIVIGEFVANWGGPPAGVYVVTSEDRFPGIKDGGCSVVHVIYDVDDARITSLKCQGYA